MFKFLHRLLAAAAGCPRCRHGLLKHGLRETMYFEQCGRHAGFGA
jgi:hypothetical protein